jgi:hypothetical protein
MAESVCDNICISDQDTQWGRICIFCKLKTLCVVIGPFYFYPYYTKILFGALYSSRLRLRFRFSCVSLLRRLVHGLGNLGLSAGIKVLHTDIPCPLVSWPELSVDAGYS